MLALLTGAAFAGALHVAVPDPPLGLDPWAAPGTFEARLAALVYDRVFHPDPETGAPTSRIAEATSDADGWIVSVRRVRWHDGRLVTADDLCFSVGAALDARAPPWWSGPTSARVAGCTVLDGRRARIRAAPGVADPLSGLAIPLVPAHGYPHGNPWFDPELTRRPNGTGRYRATRTANGWMLKATRANRSEMRTFRFFPAESDDAAVDALLAGEADGVMSIPAGRVPEVVEADKISVRWTPLRQILAVALDTRSGPTANPDVRRALDLLLERHALRARVVGVDPSDTRQPATFVSGPFFPRATWSARGIPPTPHRPDDAAALLVRAGYTRSSAGWVRGETPLTVRVATAAAPLGDPKLLHALGSQWIAAGVAVEALVLSPSAYARALEGDVPAGVNALLIPWTPPWGDSPASLVGVGGAWNAFAFQDVEVEAGLRALSDPDPEAAAWAAWRLHGRLADRAPLLFLWSRDGWSAWSESAVTFTPMTPGDVFGAVEGWR